VGDDLLVFLFDASEDFFLLVLAREDFLFVEGVKGFELEQRKKYRGSLNYRTPSEILKTIKFSPIKEGFIIDLMSYP
jgi:hypothetical protein